MLVRLPLILFSAVIIGLLVYAGCVIWPLRLLESTGLIAAISCALAWALVLAVYLDSRSSAGTQDDEG